MPSAASNPQTPSSPVVVAIVGRPNVGKSALFNRIAGRRIAIVHQQSGVTRDRVSAEVEWRGHAFTLVDTGGIGLMRGELSDNKIESIARQQVDLAIEAASLIVFAVDSRDGTTPLDEEIARMLRTSGKPVLVAVTKVDNRDSEQAAESEFSGLGFEKLFSTSAVHGSGVAELLDSAIKQLPHRSATVLGHIAVAARSPADALTKIAVVGRPNVGKSSLINALLKEDRVIVSEIPGTTRDSVDVPFHTEADGVRRDYVLIDTAGIRATRKIDASVEYFSVKRAEDSIGRCNLALLVLDAEMGVTAQDKKIGGKILDAKRACVIVVNKWDLIDEPVQRNFILGLKRILFFLDFAPVVFLSAKTGQDLPRLLEAIRLVQQQMQQDVPTPLLNRVLRDAIDRQSPPTRSGLRLKMFYATQQNKSPHVFVLFVNRNDLFTAAYQKYLIDSLRKHFGFEGCAVLIHARNRPKTIESKRGFKRSPRRFQRQRRG